MSCGAQREWLSGNIYIREFIFAKAGEQIVGDIHNFDHTTIIFQGAVHVQKSRQHLDNNGQPLGWIVTQERDFEFGSHLLIDANCKHTITALKDNTKIWCVFSIRRPDGEVIEHWDGWMPAFL